jgi:hypothetical protein
MCVSMHPVPMCVSQDDGSQHLVIRKSHIDKVVEMEEQLAQYEEYGQAFQEKEGMDEPVELTEEEIKVRLIDATLAPWRALKRARARRCAVGCRRAVASDSRT